MKVGERWLKDNGSVWKIIKLYSKFEKVEAECVEPTKVEDMDPDEQILSAIFGEVNETGQVEEWTREGFLREFKKVY